MRAIDEIKEATTEMFDALTKAFPEFSLTKEQRQFWLDAIRKERLSYFDIISGTGALIHDVYLNAAKITLPVILAACISVRRVRAEKEWQALKTQDRKKTMSNILAKGECHENPFVRELISNTLAFLHGQEDKKTWKEKHTAFIKRRYLRKIGRGKDNRGTG